MMGYSSERVAVLGSVDDSELCTFFETMFRAAPDLKPLIQEAMENSECPLS
jgi:hypothetical protein